MRHFCAECACELETFVDVMADSGDRDIEVIYVYPCPVCEDRFRSDGYA